IGIQHVVGDVCSQHITHDDSSFLSPSATLLYLLPYAHDNHSGASVYIRTACNTAIPSVSRQKLARTNEIPSEVASARGSHRNRPRSFFTAVNKNRIAIPEAPCP